MVCFVAAAFSGCNNSSIKDFTKPFETAATDTFQSCKDANYKVSDDANQVISLKSSHDQTFFIVDGKKINEAPYKLLKVCINGGQNHKITAAPTGCTEKTEDLTPPYQNTFYEFQFVLGDCQQSSNTATTNTTKTTNQKSTHKKKRALVIVQPDG